MGQTLFPNVILGPKVVPLGTIPASSKQDLLGKAGSKDLIFFEILRSLRSLRMTSREKGPVPFLVKEVKYCKSEAFFYNKKKIDLYC